MGAVRRFIRNHPARVYAVLAAVVAYASQYVEVPTELVLAVSAALLGIGESVQRVENRKTTEGV